MSARATYTVEQIDQIAANIKSAPAPTRAMSTPEAMARLAPALRAAREKGHSIASILELLAAHGVHTHARAVAKALRDAEASAPRRRGRPPKVVKSKDQIDDARMREHLEAASQMRISE